jgi:uncharacterized membrane protein
VARLRPGLHLAAISLIIWLIPLGYFVLDHHAHWIVAAVGALAALGAAAAGPAIDRRIAGSAALFAYAVLVTFAGLYLLQFVSLFYRAHDAPWTPRLVLLAILTLAFLLAAMLWALMRGNRGALWLAYGGFALEVFSLYVKTLVTLLDTSLFFLHHRAGGRCARMGRLQIASSCASSGGQRMIRAPSRTLLSLAIVALAQTPSWPTW